MDSETSLINIIMAKPNHIHMSELASNIKEEPLKLRDVQFTSSEAGHDINDLEGSVASGADVVDVIETVHEESKTASLDGSLWGSQQNESFVNFKSEEESYLCNEGIETSQVNRQMASASGNVTVKESSADDFSVYNLCSSVQNDSAHLAAAAISNIPGAFTKLEDSMRNVDNKEMQQISIETGENFTTISSREKTVFKMNDEVVEEIHEDFFIRIKEEKNYGDTNWDTSFKSEQNIAHHEANGNRRDLPQKESWTEVAKGSTFQLALKPQGNARVKPSIGERVKTFTAHQRREKSSQESCNKGEGQAHTRTATD
ncbi:hypothetical protein ElyMa_002099600 [Elysia marginata]|uniref:Uncharacterized protein n=1 Tax=Elysia marginata TaxID=1093978 RepID=A0AAV4FF43_9GAST|nr:hypothetical protein ElyMa_002099600 [Elysia marginata]